MKKEKWAQMKTNPLGIIQAFYETHKKLFKDFPELKEFMEEVNLLLEQHNGSPFEKAKYAHELLEKKLEKDIYPAMKRMAKDAKKSTKKKAS